MDDGWYRISKASGYGRGTFVRYVKDNRDDNRHHSRHLKEAGFKFEPVVILATDEYEDALADAWTKGYAEGYETAEYAITGERK